MRAVLFVSCLAIYYVASQNTSTVALGSSTTARSTESTTSGPSTTTASACKDDPTVDCQRMKPYCNVSEYHDLLGEKCPGTCSNLCNNNDCVDVGKNCAAWKNNGFCTDPFYANDKDKYCKKTCGDC